MTAPEDRSGGEPAGAAEDRVVVEPISRGPRAIALKRSVQALFGLWMLPRLLAYRASRALLGDRAFGAASEAVSRSPGLYGVYCRQAFYARTLERCGSDVHFGWQSVFSMHQARIGDGVYLGRGCRIGFADIASHVMLADGVQVLSGGREHGLADSAGEEHQDQPHRYRRLRIGRGAWIGTNAVIMADVGERAVVGAGAVVTRPVPPRAVAAGVPARVVRRLDVTEAGDA